MIKGWILHKRTAFAPREVFVENTHCTTKRWSLPVPIALAHLPNGLRALERGNTKGRDGPSSCRELFW